MFSLEGGKMQKKMLMCLALLLVVPGLLFFTSCAKKTVDSGPAMTQAQPQAQTDTAAEDAAAKLAAEKARQEEIARQKALEEERLQAEALEASQRDAMAAKSLFINEDIYFEFDSYVLTGIAQDILMAKAEWMRINPNASVTIEGHCDERGTNEYNLALGDKRGEIVKAYLVNVGVDAGRLMTISYGEEHPVDTGHNDESWAKNRRAHFVVD
jgi:peptidoglycan-associated lipoprotein